jgi:hypothetical protein
MVTVADGSTIVGPAAPRESIASTPASFVDVLVCGAIDRGDEAAPQLACDLLEHDAEANIRVHRVRRLAVDDLIGIAVGSGVVVVDSATGIDPGVIVELPLDGLFADDTALRPRSSHVLQMPEVIGLAAMIRGRPLPGRIVMIGARRFAPGGAVTRRVAAAVPSLSRAIAVAARSVMEGL